MRKITILFHSGYGHTKRVAEHVKKGVASSDVTVESTAGNPSTPFDLSVLCVE